MYQHLWELRSLLEKGRAKSMWLSKGGWLWESGKARLQGRSSLAGEQQLLFSRLFCGRKELMWRPGSLLHTLQALGNAVAGRLPLRKQEESSTTLQSPLFPAENSF